MKLYLGLAGPLLLITWLPLALTGFVVLCIKVWRWRRRYWAIPLYLVLAYLIPLGDVTWHSWNMAKVCPKAGLHVYRTVVVDGFTPSSEYTLRERGYRFTEGRIDPSTGLTTRWEKTASGDILRFDKILPKSEWEEVSGTALPDKRLGVNVTHEFVRNRITDEVIAERWFFSAWRGWVDALIGSVIDNSVGSCNGGAYLIYDSIDKILIPTGKQP